MQTGTRPHFYLPELDGLRFIAFLLVFVHNAPSISSGKIWTLLHEYGWIGVDLFFCLSAYLITRLLVREFREFGTIKITGFYVRRVLRIWPLYFLYLGIILLSPSLIDRFDNNRLVQIAGVMTFTFNFVFIQVFPFAIPALIHLWTISFEEQFYLVVPWIVRKVVDIPAKTVLSFLLATFVTGMIIRAAFVYFQIKHPAIYVLPFTRFESILGGMALGLGLFDKPEAKIQRAFLLLPGIGLLVALFMLPNAYEIGWHLMLVYLFVGAGMSLIVFSTMQYGKAMLNRLLSNPLLVYLGKVSYGLYIFHLISIRFANQIYSAFLKAGIGESAVQTSFVFFAGLMITIVIATLSYRFFESPFLRLKEKFSLVASRPI